MKNRIVFFPVGNADMTLIQIADNNNNHINILLDYFESQESNYIDLIRYSFGVKKLDYLIITHIDNDHVCGVENHFNIGQGKDPSKIDVDNLVIPATALMEVLSQKASSAKAVRQAARYRAFNNNGEGLIVVSAPDDLDDILNSKMNDPSKIKTLKRKIIKKAGDYLLNNDYIDIFIHNPSSTNYDLGEESRNENSISLHWHFKISNIKMITLGDCNIKTINSFIKTTIKKCNIHKLKAHIIKTPHHCSYKSLTNEKHIAPSIPEGDIALLYNKEFNTDLTLLVSSCKVTPNLLDQNPRQVRGASRRDEDWEGPPHRQAALFYQQIKDVNHFITGYSLNKQKNLMPIIYNLDEQKTEDFMHYETHRFSQNDYFIMENNSKIKLYKRDLHDTSLTEKILKKIGIYPNREIEFFLDYNDLIYPEKTKEIKVYWQVTNFGQMARKANQLRGNYFEGTHIRKERTAYKGHHWVEAFVLADNIIIARSTVKEVYILENK